MLGFHSRARKPKCKKSSANCKPAAAHFLLRRSRTKIACASFQSCRLPSIAKEFGCFPLNIHRLAGLPVQTLVLHQLKVHRCDAFQQVKLRETAWHRPKLHPFQHIAKTDVDCRYDRDAQTSTRRLLVCTLLLAGSRLIWAGRIAPLCTLSLSLGLSLARSQADSGSMAESGQQPV